jgi:hypothetical protein
MLVIGSQFWKVIEVFVVKIQIAVLTYAILLIFLLILLV